MDSLENNFIFAKKKVQIVDISGVCIMELYGIELYENTF